MEVWLQWEGVLAGAEGPGEKCLATHACTCFPFGKAWSSGRPDLSLSLCLVNVIVDYFLVRDYWQERSALLQHSVLYVIDLQSFPQFSYTERKGHGVQPGAKPALGNIELYFLTVKSVYLTACTDAHLRSSLQMLPRLSLNLWFVVVSLPGEQGKRKE